ncbi:hypothetical protein BJ742DRAFT_738596 [Cladochytrium replicatum]|nr:hypothetical protein BJ742DRAFT_738596 [Cladochytrium replicatum]
MLAWVWWRNILCVSQQDDWSRHVSACIDAQPQLHSKLLLRCRERAHWSRAGRNASSCGRRMVVRTNQDVKEGEELCLSYVNLMLPKQERRFELLKSNNFGCSTGRCEAIITSSGSTPSDPPDELLTNTRTAAEIDLLLNAIVCARCRVDLYVPVDPANYTNVANDIMGSQSQSTTLSKKSRHGRLLSLRPRSRATSNPTTSNFGPAPTPSSLDPRGFSLDPRGFWPNPPRRTRLYRSPPITSEPPHDVQHTTRAQDCGTSAGDIRLALACSECFVRIMPRSRILGCDVEVGGWHEYADHALFLSELAEIRAMVFREWLEGDRERIRLWFGRTELGLLMVEMRKNVR